MRRERDGAEIRNCPADPSIKLRAGYAFDGEISFISSLQFVMNREQDD